MNKKAIFVLTNCGEIEGSKEKTGWHLAEATHVYFPLVDDGFEVHFASPNGGLAPIDPTSRDLSDDFNKQFIEHDELLKKTKNTIALKEVNPKEYQVIHFPGGHGTMWDFPNQKDIQNITAAIYENKGIVAAICHGVAALINVKLSDGSYLIKERKLCSFTNEEEKAVDKAQWMPFLLESKLKERGAHFIGKDKWQDNVVVSNRLLTGQNPQSADSLAQAILEVYKEIKF